MMAGCVLPIGSAPQLRAFRLSSSRNISNCSEGVPSHPYPQLRRIINLNFSFVGPSSGLSSLHHRLKPIPALDSEAEGVPPEYPIHHDQVIIYHLPTLFFKKFVIARNQELALLVLYFSFHSSRNEMSCSRVTEGRALSNGIH